MRHLRFSLLLLGGGVSLPMTWLACSNAKPEVSDQSDRETSNGDKLADEDPSALEDSDIDQDGSGEFEGCGFGSYDERGELFDQKVAGANIRFRGVAGAVFSTEYDVKVNGALHFKASLAEFGVSSSMNVVSAEPPNAREKAEDEIRKVSGSRQASMLSVGKWSDLFGSGDWRGLHCSVFPATKIKEQTELHTTTLEFDPPIPYLVSPLLSKERFKAELPNARTFTGVKLKVTQTNNPKITTGLSGTGKVTIKPVSPQATITGNDGKKTTVDADYAYRMEFDFGDHETTMSLGLYKIATYYVKGKRFVAVSVETGIEDAPVVHYFK